MLEILLNTFFDICLMVGNSFLKLLFPKQTKIGRFGEVFTFLIGGGILLFFIAMGIGIVMFT